MGESITLSRDWQGLRRLVRELSELKGRMGAYLAVIAAIVGATAVGSIRLGYGLGSPVAVLSLAAIAAVVEWRGRIVLRKDLTVSISLFPCVFAAVMFGPTAAMIVFAASALAIAFPLSGRIVYVFNRALIGAASGGVALGVAALVPKGVEGTVAASMAAAFVAEAVDAALTSATFFLRGLGRWSDAVKDLAPVIAASVPFYGPAVAALIFAYRDISPWTLALFFAPALAAQRWFLMYQEQRRLTEDLQSVNEQLQAANLSFAMGLVATLDARDEYTAGHSAAVAVYARDIAKRMGLEEDQQDLAHLCGLVHDIGKIGLPAGILEKPGPLTLDERKEMQRHSVIGETILANVDTYAEIASIVRHHHERVDGQGYPDGIDGSSIPLLSRIIAVADAYNAMTSKRPYRDPMPSRVARLRLAQAVETQFDTSVVAAFEAILAGADEDYRGAVGAQFLVGEAATRAPAADVVAPLQMVESA